MTSTSLVFGHGQVVNATTTRRLSAVDCVWLDFRDAEGLPTEAEFAKSMGFAGKIAIHPDQVTPIQRVFTPTPAAVPDAKALLDAVASAGTARSRSTDEWSMRPGRRARRRLSRR